MTISLLGREFRVGCPEGEEKQLQASVDYLNASSRKCATPARSSETSGIAIMARVEHRARVHVEPGQGWRRGV